MRLCMPAKRVDHILSFSCSTIAEEGIPSLSIRAGSSSDDGREGSDHASDDVGFEAEGRFSPGLLAAGPSLLIADLLVRVDGRAVCAPLLPETAEADERLDEAVEVLVDGRALMLPLTEADGRFAGAVGAEAAVFFGLSDPVEADASPMSSLTRSAFFAGRLSR